MTVRCGFVTILGAPNAGKSTLVNAIVGSKVAIVTQKAQTTRVPIRGVAMLGQTQIIFVDTPGLFKPKRRLDRAMVDAAWQHAAEADAIVFLIDAAKRFEVADFEDTLKVLRNAKCPVLLALNKIDLIDRPRLLTQAAVFQAAFPFAGIFMISGLTGDGVADLVRDLARRMPEGPYFYPPDQAADIPLRVLAAEITREKLMKRLHDELPYASTVETESWTERKDGAVRIEQTIIVERDGQKAIVLGKGGATIKEIGAESRRELAQLLGQPVHLFLRVVVRPRWGEEPERYARMGLDFPKS